MEIKVIISPVLLKRWLNEDMNVILETLKDRARHTLSEEEREDLLEHVELMEDTVSKLKRTIENY